MKILARTLIILAAAMVVVAGLFAFRQTGLGQSLSLGGHGRDRMGMEGGLPPGFREGAGDRREGFGDEAQRPDGFGDRREGFGGDHGGRGGHGPSLFGLAEVVKNLVIIAISVALIALGARLVQGGRRDRPGPSRPESL